MRRSTRLDGDAQVTLIAERGRVAPYGLEGGSEGALGEYKMNRGGSNEESLFSKTPAMERRRGEVLSVCSVAGGGSGKPNERDANSLRADIEAGLISAEKAVRDYGELARQILETPNPNY